MKLHRGLKVRKFGCEVTVDVEEYRRSGTEAPSLYVLIHNGRRLVPYQWRREGYEFTFSTLLNLYLPNELLKEEMIKRSTFLMYVGRDREIWSGAPLILPIEF